MLNEATRRAVQYSGYRCRFVDLDPGDPLAYGRLFLSLWRSQATVIIVEHDVVPTEHQLAVIQGCHHDWCSYSYDDDLYPRGPMFGCVRFSGRLMVEHPWAAEVALTGDKREDVIVNWWDVDNRMARDLLIRRVEWIEHEPSVHHAHVGPPSGPA
jgi:hypothetical protein